MGYRGGKLNVAHSLAANLGARNLNAAAVAYFAFIANSFIFTAVAFPVLLRPEDALAEKSVPLRLKGAVVYCFGLFNFAVRPLADLIGRSKTDSN